MFLLNCKVCSLVAILTGYCFGNEDLTITSTRIPPRYGDQQCYTALMQTSESPKYNRFVPPFPTNGTALNIAAAIYIEGLSSVQTVTMDFSIDIYLVLRWIDERMKYSCGIPEEAFTILPNDQSSKLWMPGIYFANSRQAKFHDVMHRNSMARVWSDGLIRASTRVTLKVICNMHLEVYPFDTQECDMMFLDYSFPNTLVNVSWMPNEIEPAITSSKNIIIPEMKITSTKTDYCDGSYPSGVWSCLQLKIVLNRITGNHLYQTYLPSALIVLISFTNFWLDIDAMPGRISLSITTLLTLTTQASSLRLSLPPVSYMKALDVWMIMCQFFVLGALLEFTLVNYISRRYKAEEQKLFMQEQKSKVTKVKSHEKESTDEDFETKDTEVNIEDLKVKCRHQAQSIDHFSRILYPLLFLAFNFMYWLYYMRRAGFY